MKLLQTTVTCLLQVHPTSGPPTLKVMCAKMLEAAGAFMSARAAAWSCSPPSASPPAAPRAISTSVSAASLGGIASMMLLRGSLSMPCAQAGGAASEQCAPFTSTPAMSLAHALCRGSTR
jgi:hypothetical protein